VLRILRLLGIHAYLDLLFISRNLRDMALWAVGDLISGAAAVSGVYLLAERFGRIGPWGKWQLLFMLGYAILVNAVIELFFGYNVAWISRRIGRGQLDHTLIQPQPIWMAFATEGFVPFSCTIQLIPGIGLLAWAAPRIPIRIAPGWAALLIASIVASTITVMAFSYFWGTLAFWAPVAAEEISSNAMRLVTELKAFPLDRLGSRLTGSLLAIVPAGFVAWFPCRYLAGVEPMSWGAVGTFIGAAGFTAAAMAAFWRGMIHYGRTGSQRYLSLGHRR